MAANYNLMDVQSRALEQNYVYYQRLLEDGYGSFYQAIEGRLQATENELQSVRTDGSKVRAMARAELNKEISALKTVFNITISDSVIYDKSFYNHLLNALNRCIGIKEVYERNVLLVQRSKGQKSLVSFFPTYLKQQLEQEFKQGGLLSNQVIRRFAKDNHTTIDEAIKQVLDDNLMLIVNRALERMFSDKVGVESGARMNATEQAEYRKAYEELQNEIKKFEGDKNGSPLAQEIYNIYQMDELKQAIADRVSQFHGKGGKKVVGNKLNKKLQTNLHSRGGLTMEAVYNTVADMMARSITNGNGGAMRTGDTGMKADYIVTLGIDLTPVEELLQNWSEDASTSREKSVQAIQEMYNKVKDVNNGFIIYSNSKNYSYNKNFHGFSSGQSISAKNLEGVMEGVGWKSNFNTVVGAILQLADGAIGDGILSQPILEELLGRNIAYLLFDDVDQIGIENQSGANALHVMNLNGIYIPISLILFALADAIDDVNTDMVKKLVNVKITTPPIYFKNPITDASGRADWIATYTMHGFATPQKAWEYQRDIALNQTKIQTYFLKNFQEIIQTYITKFEQ